MRKQSLALATGLFSANLCLAELQITGVFDGPLTGGLPKGVELYSDNAIADLSLYGLGSANNGGGSDGEEFTFPSEALAAGQYVYVASESQGFTAFLGFAPNFVSNAMSINGDDAIELFKDGQVIDTFGEPNIDGSGTDWDYLDGWAFRLEAGPSPTFSAEQWRFSGANALDGFTNNIEAMIPIAAQGSGEVPPPEPASFEFISAIQGNPDSYLSNRFGDTDVSPLLGKRVTVEAVVVGDFQDNDADETRNLSGFFIQEEASDEDANPLSSEGVFVFSKDLEIDVNEGDLVRVTGTVAQYFGETQLTDITALEQLSTNRLGDVVPANITLQETMAVSQAQGGAYQPDLEAYEGMLAVFPQELTITEQFQLDRFNEIKLVAGERPAQFTQHNSPDPLLFELHKQRLGAQRITYDDGLNTQNNTVSILPGFEDYREASAPRMGDTVTGLTGVVDYKWAGNSASGATWRIRATQVNRPVFSSTLKGNSANSRPLVPPSISGNVKIASLNVLNFFTTLDDRAQHTAVGQSPRGADDLTAFGVEPAAAEYDRQLTKLVNAIVAINADVFGLVEIENDFDAVNDGSTAIEVLVNAVNSALGDEVYNYIYPQTRFVGSDAIAVGFIYNQQTMAIAENTVPALLDDDAAAQLAPFAAHDFLQAPIFNGPATNRVSLAASFTHKASQVSFTASVNHFKSKGASGLTDEEDLNFDQLDGAGFWNLRRLQGAMAVSEWLASSPTGLNSENLIILGDLNAYAMEEPVQYLLDNSYNNVETEDAYSYVFDGQVGTLDYVLVSDNLFVQLAGAKVWAVNADEADALDYNLDFGKDGHYFNGATATRYSDHDPVIVGFDFAKAEPQWQPLLPGFLESVEAESIAGKGNFQGIKVIRLWLFGAMLNNIDHLQKNNKFAVACKRMTKAIGRVDGQESPKDWLVGEGVEVLQTVLHDNIRALGCR